MVQQNDGKIVKLQVLRKEYSFHLVWKAMRGSADRFSVGEVVILWLNSCWFGKYQLVCLLLLDVYLIGVSVLLLVYLMSRATVVVVLDGSNGLW